MLLRKCLSIRLSRLPQSDVVGLGLLSDSEFTDLNETLSQPGGHQADIRQYNSCDGRLIYGCSLR